MKDNKHFNFWITFVNIIVMLILFIFILWCSAIETFTFKKEYCLFLIPVLIYMMMQAIINYYKTIDDK